MSGDDLMDLLEGAERAFASEASARTMPEEARVEVLASVRGARGRRRLAWVGAAAAAVVVVGAGLVWGLPGGDTSPAPVATTDPVPSPSASPSSSEPVPEPPVLAEPGEVTVADGLLEASPLPDGIWDSTGEGWVLATYGTLVENLGDPNEPFMPDRRVVYLVAPDGTRYQALETELEMTLASWVPGEDHAWFWSCCDASTVYVELATGEAVDPPEWLPDGARPTAFLPGGRVIVDLPEAPDGVTQAVIGPDGRVDLDPALTPVGPISPGGSYAVSANGKSSAVIDLATGTETPVASPDARGCATWPFVTDDEVLIRCVQSDAPDAVLDADGFSVWVVDLVSGEVRPAPWPTDPDVVLSPSSGIAEMHQGVYVAGVTGERWDGETQADVPVTISGDPFMLTSLETSEVPCPTLVGASPRSGGLIEIGDACAGSAAFSGTGVGLFRYAPEDRTASGGLVTLLPPIATVGSSAYGGDDVMLYGGVVAWSG